MAAYYNEIDPYAAQWLRNLIAAGHIADGVVDERDIRDIKPAELAGYTQCHFFAGIGGWSYALRLAGWPDDKPVWTGSCPCQPFSAAGKRRGTTDERHLWPHWFHLIDICRPTTIFGEQVASKAGMAWLDIVQTDLEGANYSVGAADLCAAGIGSPHIRQRSWFVANNERKRVCDIERITNDGAQGEVQKNIEKREWIRDDVGERSQTFRLAYDNQYRRDAFAVTGVHHTKYHAESCGYIGGKQRSKALTGASNDNVPKKWGEAPATIARFCGDMYSGAVNGIWRDADWLFCRDGKWRPVEPGTFPLANGIPKRVGKLRAYGNAIVPQVAAEFISTFMEFE